MKRGRPPYEDVLTPREWEVLALVERGLTNEEIAERLGVSPATAKFHVSEILSKLNLANRREAGAWRVRRLPAAFSLLKGGAFLAGTAAAAAIIYFVLGAVLFQESRAGATPMGKVAYVVDGDVWVKQLPNGPETRLTKWGDVGGDVEWSPSGEWLSVRRNLPFSRDGASSDWSTWIINADGKQERQLDVLVVPGWSPVKDEFLYSAENPNPVPGAYGQALVLEQADGSNRRVVLAANDTRFAPGLGEWTPSGEWIVAIVSNRGTADTPPTRALVRVRPDGTNEREFYRFEVSECVKKIWISKTGGCQSSDTAAGDERVPMGLYGILTDTQVIGTFQTSDEALLPLPANPIRAFPLDAANGVPSGGDIYLSESLFARSQASGRIAVVVAPGYSAPLEKRIALFDPASGQSQYVTAPGEAAMQPSWSPDGRTLFFTAVDGSLESGAPGADPIASHRIWSMDADGANRKQLTNDPRYRDEYPRATTDGTQVLFARIDLESERNTASLWLLELATGKLTMVVDRVEDGNAGENTLLGVQGNDWNRIIDWWQPK